MASNDVYSAVRAHLVANWTACALTFENERQKDTPNLAPFVYVEAIGQIGGYDIASIGAGSVEANLKREYGTIFLHVHVPAGTGSADARTKAKQLADLFFGLELAGGALRFRTASLGAGQPGDDEGKYWRVTVTVDFLMDH